MCESTHNILTMKSISNEKDQLLESVVLIISAKQRSKTNKILMKINLSWNKLINIRLLAFSLKKHYLILKFFSLLSSLFAIEIDADNSKEK